jgi:hypothetical protein
VCDCRIDLFGSGLNTEECDQFMNHRFGIFSKLGEVDPMYGDFGMFLDKPFSMFQKRTLEFVAGLVAGCEPLAWMSAAAILKGSNRGFDWAIDGDDSQ